MERVRHQSQRVDGISGDELNEKEDAVDDEQDYDARRL